MNATSAGARAARARLDAILAASKTPGVLYLAVNADGPVFEFAGGAADLGRRRPLDPATTMMAYSMSKTVTAAAALTLVEAGTLGLDDSIDRYLNDNPYGGAVTVRQLIAHTSGIPNPIPLRWVHPASAHAGFDEAAARSAVLRAHPQRVSEPGAKFAYSNIGYWLLGSVIERAAGRTFTAYVSERVLNRLAIAPSDLGFAIADPARHAAGYLERWSVFNLFRGFLIDRALVVGNVGSWVEIATHYPDGPAFGGLVGNARGLGIFLSDQLRPRSALLGDAARALFFEAQRISDGTEIPMTLGWHVGGAKGRSFYFKEGGGGGFHGMMRLYPERGIGTVVLANATGFDAAACLDAVDPELVI